MKIYWLLLNILKIRKNWNCAYTEKKGSLVFTFSKGNMYAAIYINFNLGMLVWILLVLRVLFIVSIRDSDIGKIRMTHCHQFFPWTEKVALDFIAAWYIAIKKQLFSDLFSIKYKNLIVWFFYIIVTENPVLKQAENYIIGAWCICIIM